MSWTYFFFSTFYSVCFPFLGALSKRHNISPFHFQMPTNTWNVQHCDEINITHENLFIQSKTRWCTSFSLSLSASLWFFLSNVFERWKAYLHFASPFSASSTPYTVHGWQCKHICNFSELKFERKQHQWVFLQKIVFVSNKKKKNRQNINFLTPILLNKNICIKTKQNRSPFCFFSPFPTRFFSSNEILICLPKIQKEKKYTKKNRKRKMIVKLHIYCAKLFTNCITRVRQFFLLPSFSLTQTQTKTLYTSFVSVSSSNNKKNLRKKKTLKMKAFISQFIVCQFQGRKPYRLNRDLNNVTCTLFWCISMLSIVLIVLQFQHFYLREIPAGLRKTNEFDIRN